MKSHRTKATKQYHTKHIIEFIDQTSGVTQEQLYDVLTKILKTHPIHLALTDDEFFIAVSETVVRVYQKMQLGTVPNKNYFEFNSYMYRALLSQANYIFYEKTMQRTKVCKPSKEEITQHDYDSITTPTKQTDGEEEQELEEDIERLKSVIQLLPNQLKMLVIEILYGGRGVIVPACAKLGKKQSFWQKTMKQFLKQLMIAKRKGYSNKRLLTMIINFEKEKMKNDDIDARIKRKVKEPPGFSV